MMWLLLSFYLVSYSCLYDEFRNSISVDFMYCIDVDHEQCSSDSNCAVGRVVASVGTASNSGEKMNV